MVMVPDRFEWLLAPGSPTADLARRFDDAGHELYLVGGSVRDALLGLPHDDLDFTTFDFDGLAGGPGRAFDIALKIGYDVSEVVSLNVGYRTLEGGADVDSVYNFAWLHYAVVSTVFRF